MISLTDPISHIMQLKWEDCITDDNIDGLIVCLCWSDILDVERAHIFDMYTREHSINPARKRDRPTTVFAFSRKSRWLWYLDQKYPEIFPEPRNRLEYIILILSYPLSTWNRIFRLCIRLIRMLNKNKKSKMRSMNSCELWYFSRCRNLWELG